MAYVIAAYAAVIATLVVYAQRLNARRKALEAETRER